MSFLKIFHFTPKKLSVLFIFTLIIFSCGGNDESMNPDALTFPSENLSYSQHIQPIFFNNCTFSGCHDNVSMSAGLDLLTEPPIFLSRTGLSVTPFSRQGSLLYRLLFVSDQGIPRMPLNSARISDPEIEAIGKWIDEGANTAN